MLSIGQCLALLWAGLMVYMIIAIIKGYQQPLEEGNTMNSLQQTPGSVAVAPVKPITPLVCTIETKVCCSCSALETLIDDVYGVFYEIMPYEEVGSGNGGTHNIPVENKGELSDSLALEAFKGGKVEHFLLRDIMQDMCNNGHLAVGEYLIDVGY